MNDFDMMGDLLMVMLALIIAGGFTALCLPINHRRRDNLPDFTIATIAAFVATTIMFCLREVYLHQQDVYYSDYYRSSPEPSLWAVAVAAAALSMTACFVLSANLFLDTKDRHWWQRGTVLLGGVSLSSISLHAFVWTIGESLHITASFRNILEEIWWYARFIGMLSFYPFLMGCAITLLVASILAVARRRHRQLQKQPQR